MTIKLSSMPRVVRRKIMWGGMGEARSLDEIVPGVFLGNYMQARNNTLLHKYGVTHILNVAQGLECCFRDEFVYRYVPMQDMDDQKLLCYIKDNNKCFLSSFIDSSLSQNGKVFVHCAAGISRSAATVIAYLMWKQGLHFREALALTRATRAIISPNRGFIKQLLTYECQIVTHTQLPKDQDRFICTCGGYLFHLSDVETHEPLSATQCRRHFIQPPEWLDFFDTYNSGGVLKCFQCAKAVGAQSWDGLECPCGQVVRPGFVIDAHK